MKFFRRTLAALAVPLLVTLMMPHVAHASPTSTVHSPNVDFRTWEIGFKYGVQDWGTAEIRVKMPYRNRISP